MKVDVTQMLKRSMGRSLLMDITFNASAVGAQVLAAVLYRVSGIHDDVQEIERERAKDKGPDKQLPIRTAFMGLLTSGLDGRRPQVTAVRSSLDQMSLCRKRLCGFAVGTDHTHPTDSDNSKEQLMNTATRSESHQDEAAPTACYETVRSTLDDFFSRYDWSPHRHPDLTSEERARREADTYGILDTLLDFTWSGESADGIYSIDATLIRACVNQKTRTLDLPFSNDPDAGSVPHKGGRGYLLHLISTVDAATGKRVMVGWLITVGNEAEPVGGKRLIRRLLNRGHNINVVVFDRGYGQNTSLCNWLLEQDIEILTDLKATQRTAENVAGGVAVDGDLYCPCLPERLRNLGEPPRPFNYEGFNSPKRAVRQEAQEAFADARDAYIADIEAREPYLARYHDTTDSGKHRYTCPAMRDKDVDCPLVEPDDDLNGFPKREGSLDLLPVVSGTGKLCSQPAVTVDHIVGGAPRQHVRFGTREWFDLYAEHRSPAEGLFGWMKRHDSDGTASVGDESLRIVGIGRVTWMLATRIIGFNLRQADLRTKAQRREDRDRANWMLDKYGFGGHTSDCYDDGQQICSHGKTCTHADHSPGGDYIDREDAGVSSLLDLLGLFEPPGQ